MNQLIRTRTKNKAYRFATLCLLLFLTNRAFTQDSILPMRYNLQVAEANTKYERDHQNTASKRKRDSVLLNLPFLDDFSNSKVYPIQKKWIDRQVFINSNFCINPPSYGVATFDGLNQVGYPYDDLGHNSPRGCDTLTSQYFDLSKHSVVDSLFLSFFYQQKGMGDNPESNDSFILEFKNGNGTRWIEVWSTLGSADTAKFYPFKAVNIKLDSKGDTNWFYSGFQFRFRNVGNRTGALDHWNLDYVYFNLGRNQSDTIFNDLAIDQKPQGILKTYTSMPWSHFSKNVNTYLSTKIDLNYYNGWNEEMSPKIWYEIWDSTHDVSVYNTSSLGETPTFNPKERLDREQENDMPISALDARDNTELVLKLRIKSDPPRVENIASNDEYTYLQHFRNYLAYDDGSAEAGYGLLNIRQGSVALKFNASATDTLYYVAFHFTGAFEPLPLNLKFNIKVWKDLMPEEVVLATIAANNIVFTDIPNGFVAYKLDSPIVVSGQFYIGWEQFRSYNLNVGLDRNYQWFNKGLPNPNLYINAAGQWQNSKVLGTPMIRPVFGGKVNLSTPSGSAINEWKCYPNPASTSLRLTTSSVNILHYNMLTASGQTVRSGSFNSETTISVDDLPVGFYFMQVKDKDGFSETKKVLIQR